MSYSLLSLYEEPAFNSICPMQPTCRKESFWHTSARLIQACGQPWFQSKVELGSKLDNLMLYRSQIGIEEIKAVNVHARRRWRGFRAAERLWSNAPVAPFDFHFPI